MELKRVVVTGMGVTSPLGNDVATAWANAKAGANGIGPLTLYDTRDSPVTIAGEAKFDPVEIFGAREVRRTDRVTQMTLMAADEALKDSALPITDKNRYQIGCIIGTGIGGIGTLVDAVNGFNERGYRGVSPLMVPPLLSDNIGAKVSMTYDLRGANYAIISACATGNNVIGDAADMIRLGRATAMVAGGADAAIIQMVVAGFDNIKAISKRNDPASTSRPFDADRDGLVMGEGAAVLILEELEHAKARGATIYAEITGYAHTSDAFHVTAPRDTGEDAAQAMRAALQDAGLTAADLGYINAHGTSTKMNDKSETLAIKLALGEVAYNIPISSTKSMTGHMFGAAGAFELVICIMAMHDNFVPPTINYDTPDPECDLNYTPNTGKPHQINHVMNNAFGFGGHNAIVIASRYSE